MEFSAPGPQEPGVYQMGELQARSCVTIGTSDDIVTLKYAAS
jgi:hypothetical protein